MRTICWTLCVLVIGGIPTPLRADDKGLEIVKKAIEASGGKEKLSKYTAGTLKMKGTGSTMGFDITMHIDASYALPNMYKAVMSMEVKNLNQKLAMTQIVNGNRAKMTVNGMPVPLTEAVSEELKQSALMMNVTHLTPLLDPTYKVTASDKEIKVDGKDAVGIRVSSKDLKEMKLYFDKKTFYLVKVERDGLDQATGQNVLEEHFFSNYQKTPEGISHPMKMVILQDGKKIMEMETVDYKPLEKIELKEFDLGTD